MDSKKRQPIQTIFDDTLIPLARDGIVREIRSDLAGARYAHHIRAAGDDSERDELGAETKPIDVVLPESHAQREAGIRRREASVRAAARALACCPDSATDAERNAHTACVERLIALALGERELERARDIAIGLCMAD